MRLLALGLAIISLFATGSGTAGPADLPVGMPAKFDLNAIDGHVADVVARKGITGLALAVVRDGQVVLAKGYGVRSRETGMPVEPETPFGVGSVTKQFACASILLLAEDGKLSVADKVSKYFPGLTRGDEITLHQLMTHTSGYPDYYPLDFVDRRMHREIAADDLIRQFAGGKLDFEPGSRWSYSNTGYIMLGRVVEKVSGQSFGDFLKSRIFPPAGMVHAELDPSGTDPSRARGYLEFALGAPEPARPEGTGWLTAAGGLWASAPDVARWDIALMSGQILKPAFLRVMAEPVKLTDGRTWPYGCGINIARNSGEAFYSHGGAVSGFRATNILIPRTRSAVVVLMNDEQSDGGIATAIANLIIKEGTSVDVPRVVGPIAKDAALDFFHQMRDGSLDRSKLGEEFSEYLTAARVEAASARLKPLGEPSRVEVLNVGERGGMEVASIRLTFPSAVLTGLMYRSTDGKIQQLLFDKG